MKNPAQTGSGCIRFIDWKIENVTFAEYSLPIRLRGPGIYNVTFLQALNENNRINLYKKAINELIKIQKIDYQNKDLPLSSNTTSIAGETLTYMNIKHYKYNWWNIEIQEYQNTKGITGETLIYMNIKHYKYNWWNIDIHEYQTLHG